MQTTLLLAISMAIATSSVALDEPGGGGAPQSHDRPFPDAHLANTIYLSAQPKAKDFKVFAVLRVATVIDLSGTANVHAIRSAGIDYHEMLTGHVAVRGDSMAARLTSLLNDEPPPLDAERADIPEVLAALVRQCLAKDASDRPGIRVRVFEQPSRLPRRHVDRVRLPPTPP